MNLSTDVTAAILTVLGTGMIGFMVWVVKKFFESQREFQEAIEALGATIKKSSDDMDDRITILENDDRACRVIRTRATNDTIKDLEFKNVEQDIAMDRIREDFQTIKDDFNTMDGKMNVIDEKLNKFEVTQAKQGEVLEAHTKLLDYIAKLLETALKVKI